MIGEDSPPKPTNLEGWRQAITDDRLPAFRLEAVAAAFQDLGPADKNVQNALAKHLSAAVSRILRSKVGANHPNRGEDIIFRVHGQIFEALLSPQSADGRGLREAFIPRVLFRLKDAIAAEQRQRRTPDCPFPPKKQKEPAHSGHGDEMETTVFVDDPVRGSDSDSVQNSERKDEFDTETPERDSPLAEPEPEGGDEDKDGDDALPQQKHRSGLFDEVRNIDEQINVNQILGRVPDDRKRLAFYLFMNGVPYQSKRDGVQSIARAVGVSERTAREWVSEVRALFEKDKDIQQLKNGSRR